MKFDVLQKLCQCTCCAINRIRLAVQYSSKLGGGLGFDAKSYMPVHVVQQVAEGRGDLELHASRVPISRGLISRG